MDSFSGMVLVSFGMAVSACGGALASDPDAGPGSPATDTNADVTATVSSQTTSTGFGCPTCTVGDTETLPGTGTETGSDILSFTGLDSFTYTESAVTTDRFSDTTNTETFAYTFNLTSSVGSTSTSTGRRSGTDTDTRCIPCEDGGTASDTVTAMVSGSATGMGTATSTETGTLTGTSVATFTWTATSTAD